MSDYGTNSPPDTRDSLRLKIVVGGGFGAGKTTFVGALSEIEPLSTEELLTAASERTDSLKGVEGKTTTTVAMDFGRITLPVPQVQLMLFGVPGQPRFKFLWDELTRGALGAAILADTRRLQDSFEVISYFEQRATPFVVAVNEFDGAPHSYEPDEVRAALQLHPDVPVVRCDARTVHSARPVLLTLVEHAFRLSQAATGHLPTPQGAHP